MLYKALPFSGSIYSVLNIYAKINDVIYPRDVPIIVAEQLNSIVKTIPNTEGSIAIFGASYDLYNPNKPNFSNTYDAISVIITKMVFFIMRHNTFFIKPPITRIDFNCVVRAGKHTHQEYVFLQLPLFQ